MRSSISSSEFRANPRNVRSTGKRALALLVLFFAMLFGVDYLIALGLDALLLKSQFRYSHLYREPIDADVLVFGNSRGVNSFYSPEIEKRTRLRVFNLSYNGLSPQITEALFEDYLARNRKPKVVLVEITNVATDNSLLKDLRLYARQSTKLNEMIQKEYTQLAITTDVVRSYRFNNEMFLRSLYYLEKGDQDWINHYEIDPTYASTFPISSKMTAAWHVPASKENIEAFRKIAKLASSQGIKLHFIIGPYLPSLMERTNGFYEWKQFMRSSLEDVALIHDYSGVLVSVQNFADPIHINAKGAIALIQELQRDQVLP